VGATCGGALCAPTPPRFSSSPLDTAVGALWVRPVAAHCALPRHPASISKQTPRDGVCRAQRAPRLSATEKAAAGGACDPRNEWRERAGLR
jgi:hypothetical protein